ncbi:MAG TPA: PAS domain S-box protein, partial [Solirubrobacteraceae bacterium]|nr:PAS domain S-box protein [Solirubrobacteraceae bacterium]
RNPAAAAMLGAGVAEPAAPARHSRRSDDGPRPLEGAAAVRRGVPFVFAATLGATLVPLAAGASLTDLWHHWLILAVLLGLGRLVPFDRLPAWVQAVPPMLWLAFVVVLRETSGDAPALVAPLVLLTPFWFALHGNRRHLWIAVAGVALVLAGPVVWSGAPLHTLMQATLIVGFSAALGVTIQRLVASVRASAAEIERNAGRARSSFEQSLVGMAITSKEGRLVEVNDALCRIMRRPREELVGIQASLITHPDDVDESRVRMMEVLAGEREGYTMEKRYIGGDGEVVWVTLSTSIVRDADGSPAFFTGHVLDITDRRAAEERLAESERKSRTMLSSLAEGVALVDTDCEVVDTNAAAERMLLAGNPVMVDEHGREMEKFEFPAARALLTGKAEDGVLVRMRYDTGVVRTFSVNLRPLTRPGERRPSSVLCSFEDVTEQLAAEIRIADSEERFRSLAATIPVGIFRCDIDFRLLYANDVWKRLHGFEGEDVVGAIMTPMFHRADTSRVLDGLDRATASRVPYITELRIVRPDGTSIHVELNVTGAVDDEGILTGYLGTIADITARVQAERRVRESEEHHRTVLRNLAGSLVAVYDTDLVCTAVEGGDAEYVEPGKLVGRPIQDLVAPSELELLVAPMRAALEGEEGRVESITGPTGRTWTVEIAPYRNAEGEIVGVINVSRNVTAERNAEKARIQAVQQFEQAFDAAPIGMCLVDRGGRFLRVNEAMAHITGHRREQLEGVPVIDLTGSDDESAEMRAFRALLAGERSSLELEKRYLNAHGLPIWISISATLMRDADGQPLHALAQVQDVTERRRHEDGLRHLANHDPLTGLLNRRGLEAALDDHVAQVRRYGPQGALMVVDLDGFKSVNDRLGHQAGDELIIATAKALRERVRDTDVVARLGGDEFAVLIPREGREGAEVLAASLVASIREAAAGIGHLVPGDVTASVGVAVFDDARRTAEQVLVCADLAMYDAKGAGKNRYAVYAAAGLARVDGL